MDYLGLLPVALSLAYRPTRSLLACLDRQLNKENNTYHYTAIERIEEDILHGLTPQQVEKQDQAQRSCWPIIVAFGCLAGLLSSLSAYRDVDLRMVVEAVCWVSPFTM
jgi:hypothetical protein